MTTLKLTNEEQHFSTEHIDEVYKFLHRHNLDEREFYDIVIPGYLRAVHDYLNTPDIQRYKFSTIAARRMNNSLKSHWQYLYRQCRDGKPLSLEREVSPDCQLRETVSIPNQLMVDFEVDLLLHSLAAEATPEQMNVINLRIQGFGVTEIAKMTHKTSKVVNALLESCRAIVLKVCYD